MESVSDSSQKYQSICKLLFFASITLCASVLSFIFVAFVGTYFAEGEEAIGWGYIWIFSLPAHLILGAICLITYKKYQTHTKWLHNTIHYIICIAAVSSGSLVLTPLALNIWGTIMR